MNNDYLYHHGILGQRWGVRRFQNADGSLTSAGKKRYAKEVYIHEIKTAANDYQMKYSQAKGNSSKISQKDNMRLAIEYGLNIDAANDRMNSYLKDNHLISNKKYEKTKKIVENNLKALSESYTIKYDAISGKYSLFEKNNTEPVINKPHKETKVERKQRFKEQQEAANKALAEAPTKATPGFAKYVKQEAGGFDMIDDAELLSLLEMEYESTGKKAYKS